MRQDPVKTIALAGRGRDARPLEPEPRLLKPVVIVKCSASATILGKLAGGALALPDNLNLLLRMAMPSPNQALKGTDSFSRDCSEPGPN